MVKEWIRVGESVLTDTTLVSLPYREMTQFDPAVPDAASFRFSAGEGQQLAISLTPYADTTARYFLDLFEIRADGELKSVRPELSEYGLTHPTESDAMYLLRVQPELLKGGLVEITITYTGSLAFPILGKSYLNIGSFFGVPRDGGRRTHEGVDVFAERGTPVVAVSEGRVTRVGNNRLGGNTVSVSSGNYSFYYAHLDSQLVSMGSSVSLGDTLGTVGNTGNAITTAPHLHFGIYKVGRRSVDPLPFFRDAPQVPRLEMADTARLNSWVRVSGPVVNLRQGPSTSSTILAKMEKNNLLRVVGKTNGWLKIRLPNGLKGYIAENLVVATGDPLTQRELTGDDLVKTRWAYPEFLHADLAGTVDVLGSFEGYDFVKTEKGILLWMRR